MFLITIVIVFTMYRSITLVMMKESTYILKSISVVAFIAAGFLLIQRDTYLPFLGRTAMPPSMLKDIVAPTNSNVEIDLIVDAKDGSKVIYWGAEADSGSGKVIETPQLAYNKYENAGVAVAKGGKATVRFFCPVKYQVPWGKTLDRHIHYRVVSDGGMVGAVHTTYVNC